MKTHKTLALVAAVVGSVLGSGCNPYDWRAGVASTAAIQHSCPTESIHVVGDNGDGWARVVELDVCGERRVYQDLGGARGYAWIDTTPQTAGSEQPPADVVASLTAQPSAASPSSVSTQVSDPFATAVRAHLTERASSILVCSGGPVAIEAVWDPSRSSTVTLSTPRVSDGAITECIVAAVGSIDVPFSASPGRLVHAVSN